MPTPLTMVVAAAVVAAGGWGVGSAVTGSGGTSARPAATVPPLAADPTGRPDHPRVSYGPPDGTQYALPGLPPVEGQAPGGGAPQPGTPYVPHGRVSAPLSPVPRTQPAPQQTTWPLYLSGGDLLQPDQGTATATDQSIGSNLGGACGSGLAGRWTAPVTVDLGLHGTLPGVLHVVASGPTPLTISVTRSQYGSSCSVLSSTTVTASGTQPVSFVLPRVDADLPSGGNLSLVVSTPGSARITSQVGALSYVIAPTPPA